MRAVSSRAWQEENRRAHAEARRAKAGRRLRFIEVHYGADLAAKVRDYLRSQAGPTGLSELLEQAFDEAAAM